MSVFQYSDTVCTVMGVVAIGSALIVVAQAVNNPVNAVLWLIIAFVAVACYLITAGMTFIGLSYIIVYVGAIAVLFLFVVMMLNLANQNIAGQDTWGSIGRNKIWPVAILILLTGILTVLPLSQHLTLVVDIPFAVIDILHSNLYSPVHVPSAFDHSGSTTAWYTFTTIEHQVSPFNQVQMLGITLYTYGALWLIILSVLLLLAIVVPLALAFTS